MFWTLLRVQLNPYLTAWAQMSLSQAKNIFTPTKKKTIVLMKSLKSSKHLKTFKTNKITKSEIVSVEELMMKKR